VAVHVAELHAENVGDEMEPQHLAVAFHRISTSMFTFLFIS